MHLHLFGLDSDQIRDFNAAFMEFGVHKKQFHDFYRRVSFKDEAEEQKSPRY